MSLTKCPYCAEEIQADAVKCKHCGTWLTGDPAQNPSAIGPGAGPATYAEPPRLLRSSTDKMLSGICGGLARSVGLDSTVIRIVVVIAIIFTGFIPGILAYFILGFIIPRDDAVY